MQALNKKEHKNSANGCDSPEPDDTQYTLTPRTEAKYNKINEEFELMMQRNAAHINGNRVSTQIILIILITYLLLSVPLFIFNLILFQLLFSRHRHQG